MHGRATERAAVLELAREHGVPGLVAELHLAGHVHCGDIVIDDHGSRVVDACLLYTSPRPRDP